MWQYKSGPGMVLNEFSVKKLKEVLQERKQRFHEIKRENFECRRDIASMEARIKCNKERLDDLSREEMEIVKEIEVLENDINLFEGKGE